MSPSAYITKRKTEKSGPRFVVRFRIGGRYSKLIHAGSFRSLKDAKLRRDFVTAELAAGRDPLAALRALDQPQQAMTLTAWFERFIESRIDVSESTIALYGNARDKLGLLADRDPATLAPADIQDWIAARTADALKPKTVRHYLSSIRQVLDYADIVPNPARSPKIKIPSPVSEELSPPSSAEWHALRGKLPKKAVLAARLMECDALRVGEITKLAWGDIDFAEGRLRISRARTKGGTSGQRWLPAPDELLDEIDDLLPLEDRHAARTVFGLTEGMIRGALDRACNLAKITHYHPHDLRHRRISLWVAHGIDPVTVKTWAGHASASMSLDVYSHVVIDRTDEWRDFWIGVYTSERETRVRSRAVEKEANPDE